MTDAIGAIPEFIRDVIDKRKSALYIKLKICKVFKIVKEGPFELFENPVCCNNQKT